MHGDLALNVILAAAAMKPAVGIHNLRSELATHFLLCTMINKAMRLDM